VSNGDKVDKIEKSLSVDDFLNVKVTPPPADLPVDQAEKRDLTKDRRRRRFK